jgi:hypothetical protein
MKQQYKTKKKRFRKFKKKYSHRAKNKYRLNSKKFRNFKKKQKGGDISSINVKDDFKDMPEATQYGMIYIAVGAKYTRTDGRHPCGDNPARYQLMPKFIKGNSLIIIIDTFSEEELNYNKNRIINQYNISKDRDKDNIDILIINKNFDEEMSNDIITFLENRDNIDKKLWICNYVRFLSDTPNPQERKIQQDVIGLFDKIAMELQPNVYTWYGCKRPYLLYNKYIENPDKTIAEINLVNNFERLKNNPNSIKEVVRKNVYAAINKYAIDLTSDTSEVFPAENNTLNDDDV